MLSLIQKDQHHQERNQHYNMSHISATETIKEKNEAAEKGHQSKNTTKAIKNDALKPRMSLVPQLAKYDVAKVMTYGEEKYAAYNWMEGFKWTLLTDAIDRHLTAFLCGEDNDPESGLPHLAHLACSVMMALENCYLHPELDDRWEGWKTEEGKAAREKALSAFKRSEYLLKLLEKRRQEKAGQVNNQTTS